MRIFNRLSATVVLMTVLSLTAVAGEVGTGPLAPEQPTSSTTCSSVEPACTNGEGEVGTGPSAVLALIEFLVSALP